MAETIERTISLSAEDAFEAGMGGWGVQRRKDGEGVVLYDSVLVEDDGPGSCASGAPRVDVTGPVQALKVFHVERPECLAAWLYVPSVGRTGMDGMGQEVTIELNGRPVENDPRSDAFAVDPAWLRRGDNELILRCEGLNGRSIPFTPRGDIVRNAPERHQVPPRSFRSDDHGRTWQPVDGEYLLRLHLVQRVPEGRFVSPVIDLAAAEDGDLLNADVQVGAVELDWEGDAPQGTDVRLEFRTGPTPVYDDASWSEWCAAGTEAAPKARFLQWRAVLTTCDATATPAVRQVTVRAQAARAGEPDWAGGVDVTEHHNPRIVRTSLPYEYEDVNHPKLLELRRKYHLDDVVAGAKTEFEKMVRIRDWVAKQWTYHPPEDPYPTWDALEILQRRDGFCVQYAIVCMQCCLSMGLQARFLFGDTPALGAGHEICETWSNEYGKWVYLDVNNNFHLVDVETGVPLSLREVHDLILETYYGGEKATYGNSPQEDLLSSRVAKCTGGGLEPDEPEEKDGQRGWAVRRKWLWVRMIPRNNFHSHRFPQPTRQGRCWNDTGYWQWEDEQTPRQWFYGNYTARLADWDWTINQVRFALSYGEEPDTLAVRMGTVTPGFETFLVREADGEWREARSAFEWKLHAGRSRLEMRVRTVGGVLGPVSFVEAVREE